MTQLKIYLAIALFICSILLNVANAQTELAYKYLGIEHGLSNNMVTDIYQDSKGFMWFGTFDGLNVFDGYSFKSYNNHSGDTTSLIDDYVRTISGDSKGNLWIGCQRGICFFDPFRSVFHRLYYIDENGKRVAINERVSTINASSEFAVLAAIGEKGVLAFSKDNTLGTPVPLVIGGKSISNYVATAIQIEHDKPFAWIFVKNVGLCQYSFQHKIISLVSNQILQANCLALDSEKNIWLGNNNGLFQYDRSTNKYSNNTLSINCKVVDVTLDRDNNIWVASDGEGAIKLSRNSAGNREITSTIFNTTLSSKGLSSIYIDKEDRKWFGALRGGVNILSPNTSFFKTITYPTPTSKGAAENFILSFCEDGNNIWVGTDGAGITIWNRKSNSFSKLLHDASKPRTINSDFVTSIIKDSQNEIWVSEWLGGINLYDRKSNSFLKKACIDPKTKEENKNVWLLYEDRQKNIWASATDNNGTLYLYDRKTDQFNVFNLNLGNIEAMLDDRDGNLWAGTYTSLVRVDRANQKHVFHQVGYTIRSIVEDKKGDLWLGTQGGGLLQFNKSSGNFRQFSIDDGLPSNTVLRIIEDKTGCLWLSTYKGLSRFNVEEKTFINFSASDGLQSNQFSYNASLSLASGEMLFGGLRGFNIFDPSQFSLQKRDVPVFLSGIRVNNVLSDSKAQKTEGADDGKKLTIPYDQGTLSFDFVALDYSGSDKLSYAYKLDGWDREWRYVNDTRAAYYSRLTEGKYQFYVKVKGGNGKWGVPNKLAEITVLPPWYRSWWAYLFYCCIVAGIIYLYLRYTRYQESVKYQIKLAQLEKDRERELNDRKLEFFTHISHEFRSPLSLIINPLKQRVEKNADTSEDLSVAYRNARRLLSLVDQLLLFRKADSGNEELRLKNIDLNALCNGVYQYFLHQARTSQIAYELKVPEEPLIIDADPVKMEIAIVNLLSNAFKFTPPGGAISLALEEQENELLLTVKDTGYGIRPEDQQRIFEKFKRYDSHGKSGFGIGLYLVKHFITIHNGTLSLKSEPGVGSEFRIGLPKTAIPFKEETPVLSGYQDELLKEIAESNTLVVERIVAESNINIATGKIAEDIVSHKKAILVVDDDKEMRQYLQSIFQKNYIVYVAENGLAGWETALKHVPDLIISDINMQGMDGVELCSKIKQSDTLGHIPVLLLTASSADEIKLRGVEEGADDYFTKPFDSGLLLARTEAILKSRQQLQDYFFDSITLKDTNRKVPAEYQDFLKRCILIIEENIDAEDFSIQKLSKLMGMSRSSLYQKIKNISGQSISAFIRSIRLRKAAVLMLRDSMNVNQACFQVGFSDARYFREQFVKLFGMTPSVYIKRYRLSFNNEFNVIKVSDKEESSI